MENLEDLLNQFYRKFYACILLRQKTPVVFDEKNMVINDTLIQEYIEKNPYFRFREKSFIFCESKKPLRLEYFNAQLKGADKRSIKVDGRVKIYEKLFPFITFIRNEDGLARSGWYDSKDFLSILPTRKNIIEGLLTEI